MEVNESLRRIPSVRNKEVGMYRVKLVKAYYEAMRYKVTVYPVEANGVDITAENDTHVLAIEVTNWKASCYMTLKRLKGYAENWKEFQERMNSIGDKRILVKILIYSYESNIEHQLPYLWMLDVELKRMNKQDLPENIDEEAIEGWND